MQYTKMTGATNVRTSNHWTDGELEFLAQFFVAFSTGVGAEVKKYMRFKPSQLFAAVKDSSGGGRGTGSTVISRKFELLQNVPVNLPVFEWNLDVISPSIKINVEEVDFPETGRSSTATTTEFATNFESSLTSGETFKVGLKYGASSKKAMTVTYDITTTKGYDDLGELIVNFGDDVITNKNNENRWYSKEY